MKLNRIWGFCLVGLMGCYSMDDFDIQSDPTSCTAFDGCQLNDDAIQVCVDSTCVKPPIGTPTAETATGGTVTSDIDHPGVLQLNNAFLTQFRNSSANIINITADDLIVEGTLIATSPNLTVRLRARGHIWLKKMTAFQRETMLSEPVFLTIQAEKNVYIDANVNLGEVGTCACIFEGDSHQIYSPSTWSNPPCGRNQAACTRLGPLP
jgi:hypothetical protein